jgi:hypothetical protein
VSRARASALRRVETYCCPDSLGSRRTSTSCRNSRRARRMLQPSERSSANSAARLVTIRCRTFVPRIKTIPSFWRRRKPAKRARGARGCMCPRERRSSSKMTCAWPRRMGRVVQEHRRPRWEGRRDSRSSSAWAIMLGPKALLFYRCIQDVALDDTMTLWGCGSIIGERYCQAFRGC